MITTMKITTTQKITISPPTMISPRCGVTGVTWLSSLRMEVVELTVDEGNDVDVEVDVGLDIDVVELVDV